MWKGGSTRFSWIYQSIRRIWIVVMDHILHYHSKKVSFWFWQTESIFRFHIVHPFIIKIPNLYIFNTTSKRNGLEYCPHQSLHKLYNLFPNTKFSFFIRIKRRWLWKKTSSQLLKYSHRTYFLNEKFCLLKRLFMEDH